VTCPEAGTEFVEFEVDDRAKFEALRRIFSELKRDKDADEFREDDQWLPMLDDEAKSYFDNGQAPPGTRWDFLSMIDAFRNGEYELRTCDLVQPGKARMSFFALAYPYGGVGCMVALAEAFGFRVTLVHDGAQPPYEL